MADHASLTGASLHEPKGAAAATVGTVYKADGAGSGSWTTIDYRSVPTGFLVNNGYTQSATEYSITTVIPVDDTIPQNTEGTEVLTLSHTPKASTHILRIDVSLQVSGNNNLKVTAALFEDAIANALMARTTFIAVSAGSTLESQDLSFSYFTTAASTSARTYKVRVGPTSGTCYVNRDSGAGLFSNLSFATIALTEFKA